MSDTKYSINAILANEITAEILKYLNLSDLLSARLTCSLWNALSLLKQKKSTRTYTTLSSAFFKKYRPSPWLVLNITSKSSPVIDNPASELLVSVYSTWKTMPSGQPLFSNQLKKLAKLEKVVRRKKSECKDVWNVLIKERFNPFLINMRNMDSFNGSSTIEGSSELYFLASNDLSPLHYAVLLENYDVVKLLLSQGASPNIATIDADGYGANSLTWTPLHIASFLGNIKIVQLLLFYGANTEYKAFNIVEDTKRWYRYKQDHQEKNIGSEKTAAEIASDRGHEQVSRLIKSWHLRPLWILKPYTLAPVMASSFHGASHTPQTGKKVTLSPQDILNVEEAAKRNIPEQYFCDIE